jgi:hypothetical protein
MTISIRSFQCLSPRGSSSRLIIRERDVDANFPKRLPIPGMRSQERPGLA